MGLEMVSLRPTWVIGDTPAKTEISLFRMNFRNFRFQIERESLVFNDQANSSEHDKALSYYGFNFNPPTLTSEQMT
jgi:hypothetical protein